MGSDVAESCLRKQHAQEPRWDRFHVSEVDVKRLAENCEAFGVLGFDRENAAGGEFLTACEQQPDIAVGRQVLDELRAEYSIERRIGNGREMLENIGARDAQVLLHA